MLYYSEDATVTESHHSRIVFVSALRDLPANREYSLKTDTSCRQCLVIGWVVNHKRFREDDSKSIYSQCLGESEVMENFTDL